MTDLRALREAAEKATPGPWHHCQPFQRLERQRTIHGTVPAQRVDYVSTWPDVGTPAGHRVVIPMEGRESTARSEDMAFIALANPAAIIALLDRLKEAEEALALIKGETRGCSQDMGFDREIGPLGCALGDNCVCAPVHMIARAHLERHNNE